MQINKLRKLMADEIDELTTFLNLSKKMTNFKREAGGWNDVPLSYFNRATVISAELVGGENLYFQDVQMKDLNYKFDSVTVNLQKNIDENKDFYISLSRLRNIPISELRGKHKIYSERNAELTLGGITSKGEYATSKNYVFFSGNKWWSFSEMPTCPSPDARSDYARGYLPEPTLCDEWTARSIQVHLGLAFTAYYDWHVEFLTNNFSLLIPTDWQGARHIFKNREKPEGRERRAALKHWVSNHWRTLQNKERQDTDLEEQTFVRDFLRGHHAFNWLGYKCVLRISEYDKMRDAKNKINRKKMKAKGKDRRIVINL